MGSSQALELYRALVRKLSSVFQSTEAEAMVRELFRHIAGIEIHQLFSGETITITSSKIDSLNNAIARLEKHVPLQYILGQAFFFDLTLRVTSDVLIPRPETEELVSWVLQQPLPSYPRILDIGTGSGCIAIALARNIPNSSVFGIDISQAALSIASPNAEQNNVKVEFHMHDILSSNSNGITGAPFDVVVSNPPYIRRSEAELMHPNVLEFEPHTALFVNDDDPLLFYRSIVAKASRLTIKGGLVMFEINESQGLQIIELLSEHGFTQIELKKDINGKDRMVKGVWEGYI